MFGKWEDNKITVYGPATTEPGWYPIVKQYNSIDYNTEQVEYSLVGNEIHANKVSKNNNEETLAILRGQRNKLLTQSDWTQIPDSPLSDSKKTEWATYRQTLRDLPATYSSITNINQVTWPTPPE
jgi:hypothetical protein